MSERTWTLDERLQALRCDDFSEEEKQLAWKLAEAEYFILCQKALPSPCHEHSDQHPYELGSLDLGIVRVKRIREGRNVTG